MVSIIKQIQVIQILVKKLLRLGIAQARLLSHRLKGMPVEFTSLTSSTMTRARETAMIINEDFSRT